VSRTISQRVVGLAQSCSLACAICGVREVLPFYPRGARRALVRSTRGTEGVVGGSVADAAVGVEEEKIERFITVLEFPSHIRKPIAWTEIRLPHASISHH